MVAGVCFSHCNGSAVSLIFARHRNGKSTPCEANENDHAKSLIYIRRADDRAALSLRFRLRLTAVPQHFQIARRLAHDFGHIDWIQLEVSQLPRSPAKPKYSVRPRSQRPAF